MCDRFTHCLFPSVQRAPFHEAVKSHGRRENPRCPRLCHGCSPQAASDRERCCHQPGPIRQGAGPRVAGAKGGSWPREMGWM